MIASKNRETSRGLFAFFCEYFCIINYLGNRAYTKNIRFKLNGFFQIVCNKDISFAYKFPLDKIRNKITDP